MATDAEGARRAAGARLASLFADHGRMVLGVCRLQLRDPGEAEDAAQQSFLSAYRSLLGGTEPRDAAAWLATIARNECRARVRARARLPLALDGLEVTAAGGPEEEAVRREQIEALTAALAALPDKQREAVLLRDVYGLSYGEVGAALGASLPSVESLLFRARRKLQGQLKPAAATVLVVPLSLRTALAQAVPGFEAAATGGGVAAGAAGAGLLAKLAGAPAAAKLAGVALAVGAGGGGVLVVERAALPPAARPPVAEPAQPAERVVAAAPDEATARPVAALAVRPRSPRRSAARPRRADEAEAPISQSAASAAAGEPGRDAAGSERFDPAASSPEAPASEGAGGGSDRASVAEPERGSGGDPSGRRRSGGGGGEDDDDRDEPAGRPADDDGGDDDDGDGEREDDEAERDADEDRSGRSGEGGGDDGDERDSPDADEQPDLHDLDLDDVDDLEVELDVDDELVEPNDSDDAEELEDERSGKSDD